MTTFEKQHKQLCAQYNKKLLAHHKANFSTLGNNMDYFVTYLKYLRDYYILTDPDATTKEEINLKTASIIAAVSEYEKYNSCITNYYKLNGNTIEKISDEPEEEVLKKYNIERKFH